MADQGQIHGKGDPQTTPGRPRQISRMLGVLAVALIWLMLPTPAGLSPVATLSGKQVHLAASDLAILWPVPDSPTAVANLISADETVTGGLLWPQADFERVMELARSAAVESSAPGRTFQISLKNLPPEIQQASTWKVVGLRVDPSAPGANSATVALFGSVPQIRLVLQPVTVSGGRVVVHDMAAHLAFSFTKGSEPAGPQTNFPRAIPDRAFFAQIVGDLVSVKTESMRAGIDTTGPLRVHPGLQANVPGLSNRIRSFLEQRLSPANLQDIAFMGIDSPEPWFFFVVQRGPDGTFIRRPSRNLGGHDTQMLMFRGGAPVMPAPSTRNVGPSTGVSTATLFERDVMSRLDVPVIPGLERPRVRDIPDVIANPGMSHVLNTDCVSCHTETTRRKLLKLDGGDGQFSFRAAGGVKVVDESLLPANQWNVRNFGWFGAAATITQRTANEAAEAVEMVNREYLETSSGSNEVEPAKPTATSSSVSSPLTLVMTVKSANDAVALRMLINRFQALPADQNPITSALTRLGMVHFARFVFLNERQLAVITTYDGSFERYVDAFVDALGGVFDAMLAHVSDAPPLPVSAHRPEFLEFVRTHDVQPVGPLYSAYPQLKVLDILTSQTQVVR